MTVQVETLLDAVSAAGAGSAIESPENNKTFQITGTFVGTVKIQASLDGTDWVDLLEVTAPVGYENDAPWLQVRGNVTAYTSGNITLKMGR